MTTIEKFKKEKNDHESIADGALKSLNDGKFKDSSRDKFRLSLGSKWYDRGESMGVLVGYSGFYGDSNCSYHSTPRLAEYLKKVINSNMKMLVEKAIEMSEKDVEKTRLAAVAEAEMVLQETK